VVAAVMDDEARASPWKNEKMAGEVIRSAGRS
jgi:hypothetical protein